MIHVGFISTLGRLRQVDPAQVKALAESIKEVGLLNPITVYRREIIRNGQPADGYGLVAGAHRLEACKSLGWSEVPAVVVELDDDSRIIAECDENLCGSKLTAAEVAMFTAKRKEAYLRLHPETAAGVAGAQAKHKKCANEKSSFADDQAAKTGTTTRKVQIDAERGEKVTPAALAMVKGTPLDTGVFLDKLKKVAPDEQCAFVQRALDAAAKPKPDAKKAASKSKIDADVKGRAAKEVAEMLAEHVPGEWWDALKANLYAAGANNIANEFTNVTGQSLMGKGWS
jgi:ParB family chromosome partitioning protein